jgi:hypothetical protein
MARSNRKLAAGGSIVGLDLTASRARAAYGPTGDDAPRPLLLDEPHADLPLAISLEDRAPSVGRDGYGLIRGLPHEVCRGYLSALGQAREWRAGRHRLNAAAAVGLLAQRLRQPLAGHTSITVTLPSYLSVSQVATLSAAFETAKLPIAGTITAPLTIAATSAEDFATAVVAEADEHALTWSVLAADGGRARVLTSLAQAALGADHWMDCLIDAVSDRCIRLCRRDPRDSGPAEQAVFEQIDAALDRLQPGTPVELHVRTSQWYQLLNLASDDIEHACGKLTRQAVDGMSLALAQAHAAVPAMAPPDVLWLTADAARLPGLVAAVTQSLPEPAAIRPLTADSVAVAVHAVGERLPRGHTDSSLGLQCRLRLRAPTEVPKPQAARPS